MKPQDYDLNKIINEIHQRKHPLVMISSLFGTPEWNRYLPFINDLLPHPKESVKILQKILNPPDRILIFTSFTESYTEKLKSLPSDLFEKIDICSIPNPVSDIFTNSKIADQINRNAYRVICIDEMREENYPLVLKAFKKLFSENHQVLSLFIIDRSFKIDPSSLEKSQWLMSKTSEIEKKCQLHFHFETSLKKPILIKHNPQKQNPT